ncbi:glutamate decarboxylase [Moorella sulfitireducens (nom. illeg.)]|uniref:glutamate decarboxylase n=1 Tax=Neomoorella sulfitireducens TaxID=2972948 RepID=UPI0021ABE574|nr:glutamate decarboxylase [Moorella sulfitireducens]
MWTVIYIASNHKQALRLKEILTGEGIMVNLRPIGSCQMEDLSGYELLVPESEAEEANEILNTALVR